MKKLIFIALKVTFLWIVVGTMGLLSYCDKPLEPVGASKEYKAYFWDAIRNDSNWYYSYSPSTNALDSVFLPFEYWPVASADGKRLFISNPANSNVAVIETDSFTIIDQLPYDLVLAASPDNRFLLSWETGNKLFIIRNSDYVLVYQDSNFVAGQFSKNSQRLYALTSDRQKVIRFEINDSVHSSAQYDVPFGIVTDYATSFDESRIFYYLQTAPDIHYFAVYSITLDSIVFAEEQIPGFGRIAISPDSRFAFYTNPGQALSFNLGPGWISVFDICGNELLTRITSKGVLASPYENGLPINEVSVTPDNNWLVALPLNFGQGAVFTVSLRKLEITKHIEKVGNRNVQGLSIQNGN
ncbi:MAG: hypothetical protein ACREBV_00845 [Candidatus Zixiibacteriota bacterium]